VETNIVIFRLKARKGAPELVARLKKRGILASAFSADAIRLVTHLDVNRNACQTAAKVLAEEIAKG
jgi:threonine aldolase